ncbi:MAG: hypothetical protein IPK13_10745 [Deltaproteobacteria bacterium]|nr:hypothetical protein [Deltaproteobacteria bacterium]
MLGATKTFGTLVVRDLLHRSSELKDPAVHRKAAVDWLIRAHEVSGDGGVSYGYALRGGGWRPSYRETTGYILETFFDLHHAGLEPTAGRRALEMARWCVAIQNEDGSIANPRYNPGEGIVFDTGQVLFGLVRAYEETQDPIFMTAAERAGGWLVGVANEEGRWTRNTHLAVPHVYNTRVAWALLRLNQIAPNTEAAQARERVARANLDWALTQEREGGYELCAFEPWNPPFTHTIAYALRGLLESSKLLGDDRYLASVLRVGARIRAHVRSDGFIPGEIDPLGNARASYCCLTGNCQLALVWAQLFASSGDVLYKNAALDAVRYVMRHQDLRTSNLDIRGAIPGSQPIWGRYAPMSFPNWASKFFVDAVTAVLTWLA